MPLVVFRWDECEVRVGDCLREQMPGGAASGNTVYKVKLLYNGEEEALPHSEGSDSQKITKGTTQTPSQPSQILQARMRPWDVRRIPVKWARGFLDSAGLGLCVHQSATACPQLRAAIDAPLGFYVKTYVLLVRKPVPNTCPTHTSR
ncbi:hypothetical protein NDU88_000965 [Pleurodeles waltl]|uniref:Uncharacterized protein n=1 Tax=Pleurodeles waltl TaxID=8319 RepID=A0AAV7TGY4_PLEWA|nr:hypothetical protein NDU88_000965 [Pleurodeles waltl]